MYEIGLREKKFERIKLISKIFNSITDVKMKLGMAPKDMQSIAYL